jgi:hypothetical protein
MKPTLLILTALVALGAGANPSPARGQVADGPAARGRGAVAFERVPTDTLVARLARKRPPVQVADQWRTGQLRNDRLATLPWQSRDG